MSTVWPVKAGRCVAGLTQLLLRGLMESLVDWSTGQRWLRGGWTFPPHFRNYGAKHRTKWPVLWRCSARSNRGEEAESRLRKGFGKCEWRGQGPGGYWWQVSPPASCQLIDFNDVSERWPVALPPGSPCPSCPPRQQEWQQHTNKAPHGTDWEV